MVLIYTTSNSTEHSQDFVQLHRNQTKAVSWDFVEYTTKDCESFAWEGDKWTCRAEQKGSDKEVNERRKLCKQSWKKASQINMCNISACLAKKVASLWLKGLHKMSVWKFWTNLEDCSC